MAFMSNPATSGRSASHPIAAYFVLAFLLGIGPVLGTLGDDTRLPSFEETLGPRSVKSFTGAGNFLVLMCDKAFPSSAADSGLRAPAVPMLEPGRVEASDMVSRKAFCCCINSSCLAWVRFSWSFSCFEVFCNSSCILSRVCSNACKSRTGYAPGMPCIMPMEPSMEPAEIPALPGRTGNRLVLNVAPGDQSMVEKVPSAMPAASLDCGPGSGDGDWLFNEGSRRRGPSGTASSLCGKSREGDGCRGNGCNVFLPPGTGRSSFTLVNESFRATGGSTDPR
mmetsp:Transcript_7816/g.14997  ORF Transcript_7816/g.14997 Transcript_7816/m.14997 type:complete len:280 (+) Transcript_7816:2316-3155(+)